MTPDTDDFSDLDAIIADAEARRASAKNIAARTKKLAGPGLGEEEKLRLLAELRQLEDRFVWRTVAAVALFHSQHCLTCGHNHRFFMGWMTLQQHRNDPNCRRYTRGRPEATTDTHTEDHAQADVELCADCAESCIAIDAAIARAAIEEASRRLEPKRGITEEDAIRMFETGKFK